jgi:hypothetical protein
MKIIFILSTLVALASCDKSTSQTEDSYTSAYGTTNGKACESSVISHYNKLLRICGALDSSDRSSVINCINQADTMISKYPDLNCTSTKLSTKTLNDETITVNGDSIRKLQNGFTFEKYLNYKDGKTCGEYFMTDLANAVVASCNNFKFEDKNDMVVCEYAVKNIFGSYPNFNCTYKVDNGESDTYRFNDLKEVYDTLKTAIDQ